MRPRTQLGARILKVAKHRIDLICDASQAKRLAPEGGCHQLCWRTVPVSITGHSSMHRHDAFTGSAASPPLASISCFNIMAALSGTLLNRMVRNTLSGHYGTARTTHPMSAMVRCASATLLCPSGRETACPILWHIGSHCPSILLRAASSAALLAACRSHRPSANARILETYSESFMELRFILMLNAPPHAASEQRNGPVMAAFGLPPATNSALSSACCAKVQVLGASTATRRAAGSPAVLWPSDLAVLGHSIRSHHPVERCGIGVGTSSSA